MLGWDECILYMTFEVQESGLYWVEQYPHLKKFYALLEPVNVTLFGNKVFAGGMKLA